MQVDNSVKTEPSAAMAEDTTFLTDFRGERNAVGARSNAAFREIRVGAQGRAKASSPASGGPPRVKLDLTFVKHHFTLARTDIVKGQLAWPSMIGSVKHKGLRQLLQNDDSRGVAAEHVRKIKQILAVLQAAGTIEGRGFTHLQIASSQRRLEGILVGHGAGQLANRIQICRRQCARRRSHGLSLTEGMEMKSPPHPGELIGDNLDELNVTIVNAADALGITRQQLHNLISGRSGITPEMAVKLEKAIGSTADTWL